MVLPDDDFGAALEKLIDFAAMKFAALLLLERRRFIGAAENFADGSGHESFSSVSEVKSFAYRVLPRGRCGCGFILVKPANISYCER